MNLLGYISLLLCLTKGVHLQGDECEYIYVESVGTTFITSHEEYLYQDYGNLEDRCWRIEGPDDTYLEIWTLTFDLEFELNCEYDSVTVSCDYDDGIIDTYCGYRGIRRHVYTSYNQAYVHFITDNSETGGGFKIVIRANDVDERLEESDCRFEDDLTEEDFNDSSESSRHNKNQNSAGVVAGVIAVVTVCIIIIPCIITCICCCVIIRKRNGSLRSRPIVQTYPPNLVMTPPASTVMPPSAYTMQQSSSNGYPTQNVATYPTGNIAQPPAYQPEVPKKSPDAPPPEYEYAVGAQRTNEPPPAYDNQVYSEIS